MCGVPSPRLLDTAVFNGRCSRTPLVWTLVRASVVLPRVFVHTERMGVPAHLGRLGAAPDYERAARRSLEDEMRDSWGFNGLPRQA